MYIVQPTQENFQAAMRLLHGDSAFYFITEVVTPRGINLDKQFILINYDRYCSINNELSKHSINISNNSKTDVVPA
jgi:hypothetical protein